MIYKIIEHVDETHWRVSHDGVNYRIKPSGTYINLLKLNKPYLPKYIEEIEINNIKMCVYEEVEGKSLYDCSLTNEQILDILQKLTNIINDLNSEGYIHGDLRDDNIIIGNDMNITIIDLETVSIIDSSREYGLLFYPISSIIIKDNIVLLKEGWKPCKHIDLFYLGIIAHSLLLTDEIRPMINSNDLYESVTQLPEGLLTFQSCGNAIIDDLLDYGNCSCNK